MKKVIRLIAIGLYIPSLLHAQQVVASAGGSMDNNTVQVNWTIGETITEAILDGSSAVTSGFNQPVLKIISSTQTIKKDIEISIYPNPTSQLVHIKYSGKLPVIARVVNSKGNICMYKNISEPVSQLDFSAIATGVYFIEIIDASGSSNTFRVIKH